MKRIGLLTGGGDAPGLNAVIRSVVRTAETAFGAQVLGIRDGFDGLLAPDGIVPLQASDVVGILGRGGTILGTANRGNPFARQVMRDGQEVVEDVSGDVLDAIHALDLEALIVVGGDGTLHISLELHDKGCPIIGVPKTIDNDLDKTVVTFGFDTAVHFATECIDRLHSTAEAHQRIMVVEVMGRYAGWIALNSGVSATADAILIPEIPFDLHKVAEKVMEREHSGRRFSIIVAAEGARPKGGKHIVATGKTPGRAERLGGIGQAVCSELAALTGKEARTVVLGHLLRGGTPTSFDRLLSLRFGAASVRALDEGQSGVMVVLDPPAVTYVPLDQCTQRMKTVPPDCDTVLTARDLGISFGD